MPHMHDVVPAMADSTVTTAGTNTVSASEVRTEAKAQPGSL